MKKVVALGLFFFAGLCLQAQDLSWDIKFLKGRERESLPINRIITMQTGDEFLIIITPGSPHRESRSYAWRLPRYGNTSATI